MKNLWKLINVIIIVLLLPQFSCDDRVPKEVIGGNYVISISTQPIEGVYGNNVGEDLVGDGASTRLTATVSDNNNNKIKDATLTFTSTKSNVPFGTIDPSTGVTKEDGTLSAIFRDGSVAGANIFLRATYNENTDIFSQTEIQVFPDSVVWPYNLILTTNTELIFSDEGTGQATLTVSLFNKLGLPVKNVDIDFVTNHGSFGETNQQIFTVITDSAGIALTTLNHNNDLGLAEITAYFTHEGTNTTDGLTQTKSDTKQIIIASNANISLASYPVARDSEDNWVYVGEDIIGDIAMTRVIATVTDYNGNPISGVHVLFKSECLGDSVGTISFETDQTILSGNGAPDIFPDKNIMLRPESPSFENHNNSTEDITPEKVNISPNKRTIEKQLPTLKPGLITSIETSTSNTLSGPYTNNQGQVIAYFNDLGVDNFYIDFPETPEFEGIVVSAYVGDELGNSQSAQFNVYSQDVYPYELILNTGTDEINLDDGATTAIITGTLRRGSFNEPVGNVTLSISSDRGYIVEGPWVTTDSTGQISLTFQDQNLPEDVGMATITASYTHPHPDFGSTVADSVQVSIVTNYTLSLTSAPRSLSNHPIGEDIEGDLARTLIMATLTDQSGDPVPGQTILFKSMSEGMEIGMMTPETFQTDEDGIIIAFFDDGGDHYFDDPRTPEFFEGVEVTAYIGDETGTSELIQFDVWPYSVWPYHLSLSGGSQPEDYEIQIDPAVEDSGFCEIEDLYVTLVSGYTILDTLSGDSINNLISDALITFDNNIGDIEPEVVTTDTNGHATVEITNYEDDLGLSTIVARYTHPSFGVAITDTVVFNILCQMTSVGPDITMSLTTTPMYGGNIVGEDVAGDAARTHIMATLNSSDGTPIANQAITFEASAGVITYVGSDSTDSEGRVFAIFDDGGVAVDDPISPQFEGVIITASSIVASASIGINVYNGGEIYPYHLTLNSDVNEIILDNGSTTANITGILLNNGFNEPVRNVILTFSSDRGHLVEGPWALTDSTGQVSMIFQDRELQEDIGMATITGSYTHPGFGSTITSSVQVSIVTNYALTLTSTSVSSDNTVVGEDVAGDTARTHIVATLTNQSGSPVSGQTLLFRSRVSGNAAGTMTVDSSQTDVEGKIYTYFDDRGSVYQDNSGTEDFEGVVVTAYIGSDTTGQSQSVQFNVYHASVWPYELILNSDVDEISLDHGATAANITGLLLNGLNQPAGDLTLLFSSDRGYISSQAVTGSDGSYNLVFQDQGLAEDVGMSTISASYTHPGFGSTITSSVQVSIVTNYALTLTSTSVSSDNTVVGEDVAGDTARTRIVATLTDQSGSPVSGQTLLFRSRVSGNAAGTMTVDSSQTDVEGKIYTYFDDRGSVYQDNSGTEDFEGVVVTAYIGSDTTGQSQSVQFNVYPASVWPYELALYSEVDEISLDHGATAANITGLLLNALGNTLSNVTFLFEADRGYIEPMVTSDSTGLLDLAFQDLGSTDDIGMATITGTFIHPGFNDTLTSEIQIFINAHYNITLVNTPIAEWEGDYYIVGEDIKGSGAYTRLTATVTDSSDEPISGIPVEFHTTNDSDSVGIIQWIDGEYVTDGDGQIQAIFDDDDHTYLDNPGSPGFEGVTAVVLFGDQVYPDEPVQFNVDDSSNVWPYNILIDTDTDVIQLDAGESQAAIVTRLINGRNEPVKNVQLSYSASLGYIDAFGMTDSVGVDTVYFYDLGSPDEVGISNIISSFIHPTLGSVTSETLNITIEDTTFQECEYITIPPSPISEIMITGGGGIESTDITVEVYDDNGVLVDTPTLVRFVLGPNIPTGAHLENGTLVDSSYTNNGVASIPLNSGTAPGPVRVTVFVDCAGVEVSAVASNYVIIVTGPPYYMEANWDPFTTEDIGAGFYRVQCGALAYDRHMNPVADSTYIYWTIDSPLPCTETHSDIIGTSLTYNTNWSGQQYLGMAFSEVYYSTNGIGDDIRIKAYAWGDDLNGDGVYGDSLGAYVNEEEGGFVTLPYIDGGAAQVALNLSVTSHDFSFPLPTDSVIITATTYVSDHYGNPVINAPVIFTSDGAAAWQEVGFEVYEDVGIDGYGAGDGCFTWRDFGADGDEGTLDCGEGNDNHDAFDENGDIRHWSHYDNEYSEPFMDCGLDGMCPGDEGFLPDSTDDFEGNGSFQCEGEDHSDYGYTMNCQWDPAEPYDDFGIDGIDETGDPGEGNGQFDRESFSDDNDNGHWDDVEDFDDFGIDNLEQADNNGDGDFDDPGEDNNGDGDFNDPGEDNNGDGDFDDPGEDNNGDGDFDDPGDVKPDIAPDVEPDLAPDEGEGNGDYDWFENFTDLDDSGQWNDEEPFDDCGYDGFCPEDPFYPGTPDWGEADSLCQDGERYYDTNLNGQYDDGEPFEDCGWDGICGPTVPYPGIDEGENDGEWYGYHMEGCGWPDIRVRTDANGIARVSAIFYKTLCAFNGLTDLGGVDFCTYDEFPADIQAVLGIPIAPPPAIEEIQLSRTMFEVDPVTGCE